MATKKAAKKVVEVKKSSSRGGLYSSTGDGRKKFADMKGQGKIIGDALVANEPISSADLASTIGGAIETKQTVERVVGFYLAAWKKEGYVKATAPAKQAAEPKAEKPAKAAKKSKKAATTEAAA